MRRISFRQRRRALGGEHVDTPRLIHAACVRVIPGALTQRDNARHHTRRHFGFDMHLTAGVENTNSVAVGDTSRLRIKRINPHLLATGRLQHVYVAVGRVHARFIVEAGQLQRELLGQRIVIVLKAGGINRQRIDNVPFG